jgi:anti-sigma factor RsiW
MRCKSFRDRIIEYVDNRLPDQERREMDEHLRTCSSCACELKRTRQAFFAMAGLHPPRELEVEPGLRELRRRLDDRTQDLPLPWVERLRWALVPALALTAVAAVALLTLLLSGPRQPDQAPPVATTTAPADEPGPAAPAPVNLELADLEQLSELLENLPLFEHLEWFSEPETLSSLMAADDQQLDDLLAEVGG